VRWPLRFQILLPLAGLTLVTVLAVSLVNAYLAARRARIRIEGQLRAVAHTLADSSFPLTDGVLAQTAALSGAEFLLTDSAGEVLAGSRADFGNVPADTQIQTGHQLTLGRPIQVGSARYFHAAVRRTRRSPEATSAVLHLFYPEESWQQAWRDAVVSPLVVGGGALVVAVILAVVIAGRVTHPLRRLGAEVDKIADGDFRTVAPPHRNDEVRDLAVAIDRMVRQLERYEQQVRRSERLRTLGQLGGGIAHQIRNSATGCRMALDLLAREMPEAADSEHLEVARRQLRLMEEYLGRLLTIGRPPADRPRTPVDLAAVVDDVMKLVAPAARHVHVDLDFRRGAESFAVKGHRESLEQLLVNLLINAVDAAGRPQDDSAATEVTDRGHHAGRVEVRLAADDAGQAVITVFDSGLGPSAKIGAALFEPLVTDKPDGSGLGLSVAREIAEQHGGSIDWERRGERTCFFVELPLVEEEFV
jgi:signal transduction histidine kinase